MSQPPAYEPPDDNRPASSAPTESQLETEAIGSLKKHDPYAALRFPAYRLFSIGWMVAVIGSQMTAVALGWELFDRTHRLEWLGYLAGVQVIPLIFLALPAGVIADRVDRRRLVQVTAFLNALCSLGLALLSYRAGSLPWMVLLVGVSAAILTIGRPARSAILPRLVPPAAFANAITWNSSIFQISAMLGPALGGLLIARSERVFHSLAIPYAIDAASALFYALIMLRIPKATGTIERSISEPKLGPLQQLSAGIRFVYDTRIIFATLTLDLFAVLLGGAVYLLPVFVQDILHVDSFRFGWLRAAEAIGAVGMAMLIAHRPPMKRAGRSMLLAVAMFGVCTIVFGLSRSYWLSLFMLVGIGAFDNISVVVRHTLVQVLTPDAMRGRVSAVNNIFIGASNELGGVESTLTAAAFGALAVRFGATADHARVLGPTLSVVIGGVGTIATVLLTAWLFPQLRKYGPLQPHTTPEKTLTGRAGTTGAAPAAVRPS
ncbi:MAG: transporter [Phycisphaerales bacterium]|nr:transporter [Phycisphaerales bacterium]